MQFPKDLINALKTLFTKVQDFMAPFEKQFASALFHDLVAISITAIAKITADPSIVTTADKRAAALKDMETQALSAGMNAGETALANALQVAYTQLNPEKATITLINTPVADTSKDGIE
jgi:hypothetical protein